MEDANAQGLGKLAKDACNEDEVLDYDKESYGVND